MATGDALRAWMALRRIEDYRAAWREHAAAPPALEPGPFPIRVQDAADLEAARFDLLAWADPRGGDGPASPFWVQEGMAEAALAPGVAPLAGVVADGGGIELRHPFGLGMPHGVRRLLDFWQVAGRPSPPPKGRTGRTATWRS